MILQAEYYDLHPKHLDNHNGAFTYNYLPPGEKWIWIRWWNNCALPSAIDQQFFVLLFRSLILGLHRDTSRSLRIPFCAMRFWYLHMTGQSELNRLFDPQYKPKNTRENFLLYIVSANFGIILYITFLHSLTHSVILFLIVELPLYRLPRTSSTGSV